MYIMKKNNFEIFSFSNNNSQIVLYVFVEVISVAENTFLTRAQFHSAANR